jgi:tetratricopeptide (TPR) repeat protein
MKFFHPKIKSAIVGLVLVATPALAEPVADAFSAYEAGDFSKAAREFETALASGPKSAGLYFNLGQALKKGGEAGPAALNYRRALMLDPRLMDARVALSDIERSKGIPLAPASWKDQLIERVPLFPVMVVGFSVFWMGAFLGLLLAFRRPPNRFGLVAAFALVILGAAIFVSTYLADPRFQWRSGAVVVAADGVSLLSAPAERSPVVAKLPTASLLRVVSTSGEWAYAKANDGKTGWLPRNSITDLVQQK